jgi:hypothetical protein
VATSRSSFDSSVVAAATVPEGVGRTSWTVPFELTIGVTYYWRVQAIDIASSVASSSSAVQEFEVISSDANFFMLDLRLPAACLPSVTGSSFALYAWSADVTGGGHFRLMSLGDLRLDLMTAGGSVSGTIGGKSVGASHAPMKVSVSTSNDNGAPARVSGTLGASGEMSGTFSGFLKAEHSYGDGVSSCSAPDIGWTITPRQP